MSEPIMTIKTKAGGTVRIFPDYLPKTAEERARREAEVWRVACNILANSVAKVGVDKTRELLRNGEHAQIFNRGRDTNAQEVPVGSN